MARQRAYWTNDSPPKPNPSDIFFIDLVGLNIWSSPATLLESHKSCSHDEASLIFFTDEKIEFQLPNITE